MLIGFQHDKRLDWKEQKAKRIEFKQEFPEWEIRPVYQDPDTTEGLECITPQDITMTTYVLVMYHGKHKWLSEQFLRFWQRMAKWSGKSITVDIWKQTSYLQKKLRALQKKGFDIKEIPLGKLFSLVRCKFG